MKNNKWMRILTLLAFLAFLILMIWKPTYSDDKTMQLLWDTIATRIAGSMIFVMLLKEFLKKQ